MAIDQFDTDGITLLKRTESQFSQDLNVGETLYVTPEDNYSEHRIVVSNQKVIVFDIHSEDDSATSYTTEYSRYNKYGAVETVTEFNDYIEGARTTTYAYEHDLPNWVLNLPTTTAISDATTSEVISEITYKNFQFTKNAVEYDVRVPEFQKSFGVWLKKLSEYNHNGTIASVEFNAPLIDITTEGEIPSVNAQSNRFVRLKDYHRGTAQNVEFPARYSSSGVTGYRLVVDDNGWITSHTDAKNNVTAFGYDELGRIQYEEKPGINEWYDSFYEWNIDGSGSIVRKESRCHLTSEKDGCEGEPVFQSELTFDGLMRQVLVKNTDVNHSISRYQRKKYNGPGALEFESFWSGSENESDGTHFTYDGMGRLASILTAGSVNQSFKYLSGNTVQTESQRDATFRRTSKTQFFAYGAPEQQQPLEITVYITNTNNGTETLASKDLVKTTFNINVFGEIETITQSGTAGGEDENSIVTISEQRFYDTAHNLCKVSRGDVGTTVYHHNHLGEITWYAEGVSESTPTHSNCSGDAGDNDKVLLTNDNLGDLYAINYPGATYDVVKVRDNNSNLTGLISGNVTQSYTYNSLNGLESETLTVGGERMAASEESVSIDYHFDKLGNRSGVTYPNNDIVNYAPNAFGEPSKAERLISGHEAYAYASNVKYYANGILDSFTYGNSKTVNGDKHPIKHKTTLNSKNIPSQVYDYWDSGSEDMHHNSAILKLSYTYDNNLNVTSIVNAVDNAYSLTSLSYDGLGRLTATTGGTGIGSSSIVYDGLGNIKRYTSKERTLTYVYNYTEDYSRYSDYGVNRLRSVSDGIGAVEDCPERAESLDYCRFIYDDRGNVVDNSFHTFEFNRANQLASSGQLTFVYDGHNRRVKETKADDTEHYSLYSYDGKLLYSKNPAGGVNYIYLGNKLIAKDGFIPEDSGKQHYRPFGESLEESTDDIGFTGHKYDADIGLNYMQARYYDPVIGRFYSNDPVGYTGNPHSFNRYAYANNNPYKYIDPDGNSPISVLAKQTAKVGIKQGIQNMGKRQMRRLGRYMDQAGINRKEFASEVADVVESLDSSPYEIALELIPGVGDIYGGLKFGKQVSEAYGRMQDLENKYVAKILKSLSPAQRTKFLNAMRNAGVRDSKQDRGIQKTGSGMEMHHNKTVADSPSTASDPRHIEPLTPPEHRKKHQ